MENVPAPLAALRAYNAAHSDRAIVGRTLNDVMEFDHVIRVAGNGAVSDVDNVYAPELLIATDDDGQILPEHDAELRADAERQGWTLLTGFTGQYSYNGPLMHASEFVGGGLERHILSNPGLYCAVAVEIDNDRDDEPAGWVVAYREES